MTVLGCIIDCSLAPGVLKVWKAGFHAQQVQHCCIGNLRTVELLQGRSIVALEERVDVAASFVTQFDLAGIHQSHDCYCHRSFCARSIVENISSIVTSLTLSPGLVT